MEKVNSDWVNVDNLIKVVTNLEETVNNLTKELASTKNIVRDLENKVFESYETKYGRKYD